MISTQMALGAIVFSALCGQAVGAQVSDTPGRVILQNDRLSLALGKAEKGAVVSLRDRSLDRELAALQKSPRLFVLSLTKRGDTSGTRQYLSSAQAESVAFEALPGGARVTYGVFPGQSIQVTCTVTVNQPDQLARFSLEATIPEDLVLEEVQYPFVVLNAPLSGQGEDALVLGRTKGGISPRPSEWPVNRRASARQPGSLAAQFGCYHDDGVGVVFAALDQAGYPKTVECRRIEEGLETAWDRHCFDTGDSSLGFEAAIGTFRGENGAATTWRDGADIYKAWAEKQHWCARKFADRDDVPQWFKDGPATVRFNRAWLAEPERIRNWLTGYWGKHFPAGNHLIAAYWGWEKVESWITPDYFPVFPSDEEFRSLAAFARERGVHTFPWPSGYHYTLTFDKLADGTFRWDDRERFDEIARPHAIHNRDGSLYVREPSWLRGGTTATMCPGDPWTIDWFNDLSVKLVERGADLVQVDQVVGGAYPFCYKTDHNHPPGPGLWMTEVFRRQLETMLAECRKVDPDALVCFEEPNEHFIQQVAIQDYRDWEPMWRAEDDTIPESVFNYIYHEYLPTFQSNPRANDLPGAGYCLVTGQMPHFVPSRLTGPGPSLAGGDFEEWVGSAPAGWDKVGGYQGQTWSGKCFHDAEVAHGGDHSLRLENTEPTEVVQVSQNVSVGGQFAIGGQYRLRAWLRSEGMQKPNGIGLGTFAPGLRSTGGARIQIPQDTGGEWVEGSAEFTVPAESEMLRIMIHIDGPGKVWVDDMVLERALPDGTWAQVMRPEVPLDHDFMRRWVELYCEEASSYLLHGRMLHKPPLEVGSVRVSGRELPAILHNAFRAADGSEALLAVNITREPVEGVLTWHGARRTLSLEPGEIAFLR